MPGPGASTAGRAIISYGFSRVSRVGAKQAISAEERKEERTHNSLDPPAKQKKQLTWLIVASVAAPVLGLLFAWQTYGTLWG